MAQDEAGTRHQAYKVSPTFFSLGLSAAPSAYTGPRGGGREGARGGGGGRGGGGERGWGGGGVAGGGGGVG